MTATIQQIIGKINPKLYAENGKELLKTYGSPEYIPAEEVIAKPLEEHKLVYNSSSETLEPLYFFILDLMNDHNLKPQKYVDNFSSSPGSGHFSELGTRATVMQQQGTKILADVNTVLRSVLNIIYDLKEFRTRLEHYDGLKSRNKEDVEASRLSLKQIWMDKVDIQKSNSSIKAMALGQAGFQTLIDAFLVANTIEEVKKLDLNERVQRILMPRVQEFNHWVDQSEKELKRRYEMEKTYLKSQANSLKLYARWVKPYLKAANELEMKDQGRNPALVKAFNTVILELTLLGKSALRVKDSALAGDLPADFIKESFLRTLKRNYNSCVLVNLEFIGIPQKLNQQSHYVFGGKARVSFTAYALNDEEIEKIDEELDQEDLKGALSLIEGTTESIDELQDEINFFLEEKLGEDREVSGDDESNPFKALFGSYNKKPMPEQKYETHGKIIIKKDNYIEKAHLRPLAAEDAKLKIFTIFDVYKKGHGMPSYT